tara:strand:- start:2111 stop:2497 length:387 start_codon:yes stop_codon:yes gene_type:complete
MTIVSLITKALNTKGFRAIKRSSFVSFEPNKRGARQFKPQPNQFRNLNWVLVWPVPVGNPNENPNFNQVVPVFVQMMAGKAYKHWVEPFLIKERLAVSALISAAGSLLDPPFKLGRGRLFSYPRTKFF